MYQFLRRLYNVVLSQNFLFIKRYNLVPAHQASNSLPPTSKHTVSTPSEPRTWLFCPPALHVCRAKLALPCHRFPRLPLATLMSTTLTTITPLLTASCRRFPRISPAAAARALSAPETHLPPDLAPPLRGPVFSGVVPGFVGSQREHDKKLHYIWTRG